VSAPNEAVWYILRDGQRFGPFNADAFARFEEGGQLRATDGIWQNGTDTWIAYSDYEARKAAARFAAPQRAGSSTRVGHNKCAICRWVRSGVDGLARTLITAFRTHSSHGARTHAAFAASPAAAASAPATPAREPAHSPTAPPAAEANLAPILASLLQSQDSDLRPLTSGPVLEQPTGDVPRHLTNQDQDESIPAVTTQDVVGSLHAPSIPRLVNEIQAASHIGLELATFRAWVAAGRLPHALSNSDKYDLKAIHLALDHMSGIASHENASIDWMERSQTAGGRPFQA
jgi:GYF domain 2